MTVTPQELNALWRTDFASFIERSFLQLNPETPYLPNFHIYKIAEHLEKCRRGEIKRLIINVPPRSLKSHCASVAFTAWLLGHNPAEQDYHRQLWARFSRQARARLPKRNEERMVPAGVSYTP